MSVPAQSRLSSSLRHAFAQGSAVTAVQSTTTPVATPASAVANTNQHLDVLDSVLQAVEQTAAQTPVSQPVIEVPPVQPSPAPEPAPQPPAPVSQPVPPVVEPLSAPIEVAPTPPTQTLSPLARIKPIMPPVPQAVPLAVDAVVEAFHNPQNVTSSPKEVTESAQAQVATAEAASSQAVHEPEPPAPEQQISPEVESYLQEVVDHQDQQPQEIVIADGTMQLQPAIPSLRTVTVLPITPEVEAEGLKKSPKWSVRWLVEWSQKVMKMFSGKVVYREV